MPGHAAVNVKGLRELNLAFAHADRDSKAFVAATLRTVAEPVRREAEGLATERIPNIGPKWPRMRTGVTRTLVYVAPVQRGVKKRGELQRRRPNLAPLMMDRAMEPALQHHAPEIEHSLEDALDRMADRFN